MSKSIVCRCEDVTHHELLVAIERGHKDVESAKRYTGFGTGWCQGKWCLALCSSILRAEGGSADQPFTPRPPYHPVKVATLAALAQSSDRAEPESTISGEPSEGR